LGNRITKSKTKRLTDRPLFLLFGKNSEKKGKRCQLCLKKNNSSFPFIVFCTFFGTAKNNLSDHDKNSSVLFFTKSASQPQRFFKKTQKICALFFVQAIDYIL